MLQLITDIETVMWRDWVVLRRRLKKFILSRLVTPVLYLVAFGWGLGRSITPESGTYLDFLVPGIIALNTMNVSYISATTVHAEKIYHKSLENYLSAPIEPTAFVIGKILSAVIRSFISTGLILVIAAMFDAQLSFLFDVGRAAGFFAVIFLNSMIFASVGFCAAMYVKTFEELSQVNTYFLMPMSFLCGTFFSTSQLPDFVRFFIEILPLTHTSEMLRHGINFLSLIILILYAAVLIKISCKSFKNLADG
ncbi:MAG: ABC transporter permease [Selenomonadaceae bacterium]|nr:ABC transporter permease [Selenomonadaceae bacterium]